MPVKKCPPFEDYNTIVDTPLGKGSKETNGDDDSPSAEGPTAASGACAPWADNG